MNIKFIEFTIKTNNKTQFFGIPVEQVKEIIKTPQITKMPQLQECIDGVIDLRGKVVSMFNFAKWIKAWDNSSNSKKTIIVEFELKEKNLLGFMVSDVTRIHRVEQSNLKKTFFIKEEAGNKTQENCLVNIAKIDEKLVGIIDVNLIIKNLIKGGKL